MRKIHIKLGDTVNDQIKDIEYGLSSLTFKRLNNKLTVGRMNSESEAYRHPITAVHNIKVYVVVRYCSTNIVTVGRDSKGCYYCYINDGGYPTRTTKNYINAVLNALRLPYYLRIRNHRMELICTKYNRENVIEDFRGEYLINEQSYNHI